MLREADEVNRGPLTGWAATGKLLAGGNFAVPPVQARFAESGYYTAEFNINIPTTKPAALLIQPRAEIIWTVAGNSIRRLITFGHGTAISGTGQSVNVTMTDYSVGAGNFQYDVTCTVSKGQRPTGAGSRPPILYSSDLAFGAPVNGGASNPLTLDTRGQVSGVILAPGQSNNWGVPVDCGANAVLVNILINGAAGANLNDNDVFITQLTNILGAGGLLVDAYGGDSVGIWMPLSAGAQAVTVLNNTAAQVMSVSLAWGIEG